ncbi:MAG TPA: fused MFS/spermidine synthase [Terriglobales bacterium]|nr:fused MFS/spermidine synthase [Terriglobales bacterium]
MQTRAISANATPKIRPELGLGSTFVYGATVFTSAFLLFQVEPLIANIILPWMGGAAAVWSVCLLFFQTVLLLGYLYAHWLANKFQPRVQGRIHIILLAASLLSSPILPKDSWKPSGAEEPALRVLFLLTMTVGLPYFLLSSTSPLLQAWYARTRPEVVPYRFYALSNGGSLLGLLSYPLLVEPIFSRAHQAVGWSIAYGGVVILCGIIALIARGELPSGLPPGPASRPDWRTRSLWVALAACGSALLLGVTNHISQNIAAVPFLWVIPLSLYLLSFILCFEGRAWYRRGLWLRLLGLALGGMAYALAPGYGSIPLYVLLPLYCVGLFVCCMVCHGELARLKPHSPYLTSFYLMVSLGGAVGALFVALLAPRVFSGWYELPIAMAACAVLVLIVLHRDPTSMFYRARWKPAWLGLIALAVGLIANLSVTSREQSKNVHLMVRNFYGVLRVEDLIAPGIVTMKGKYGPSADEDLHYRELLNGTIDHGTQFLSPARRREPTSYYSPDSGIGLALKVAGQRGRLRVGVIGLGAGTIAAYGRSGDSYVFYEINPLVLQIANREFSFLRDSSAKVNVILGDARLSLEQEKPQDFDVLAVDAFSGDSIPVHLLTREAFRLYFRHLKPDGILAVHISNKYLNLEPVVEAAADTLNKKAHLIENAPDAHRGIHHATWVLLGSPQGFEGKEQIAKVGTILDGHQQLWTDDYSSLLRVLK